MRIRNRQAESRKIKYMSCHDVTHEEVFFMEDRVGGGGKMRRMAAVDDARKGRAVAKRCRRKRLGVTSGGGVREDADCRQT